MVFWNVTQCRMVNSYEHFDGSSFPDQLLHIFSHLQFIIIFRPY